MPVARLPSLAVGNGRLLVTLDSFSNVLSACWPCVDSPSQFAEFSIIPTQEVSASDAVQLPKFGYVQHTNTAYGSSREGLFIEDLITDFDGAGYVSDVHVRRIKGPHPNLTIYLVPELDGRSASQTMFWDGNAEALLAFHRDKWVAIASERGRIHDFHCGRLHDESSGLKVQHLGQLPRERIAFRSVDGILRVHGSAESLLLFTVFGHSRESILSSLDLARSSSWSSLKQRAMDKSLQILSQARFLGWSDVVNHSLARSCLVIDLLTNRDTGGTIAGPNVQSGLESAPDYAAVWGRDAAWTMLGILAIDCTNQATKMLQFALKTQAPEGLWLQRHHTDYTTASSWGLHQIDETGILLHAMACYFHKAGSKDFFDTFWPCIAKAANFLIESVDQENGLPFKSVDLWEEREGLHLYTIASVIAGLRAASYLAERLTGQTSNDKHQWTRVADEIQTVMLDRFWDASTQRFVTSMSSSSALPMIDRSRPELSAVVQNGLTSTQTALPQYPNWRDARVTDVNYGHDISTLALAVPFGILALDDERVVSTVQQLRSNLWNESIGGLCRYEGDSYGGGNPWPLATLWLAIYEGARGNVDEARRLVEWVLAHTTEAGLVPEQVDRNTGKPIAAVPLSWSHGMVCLAVAACSGDNAWNWARQSKDR